MAKESFHLLFGREHWVEHLRLDALVEELAKVLAGLDLEQSADFLMV